MTGVKIEILSYTSDAFPGWVACRLVDALGQEHHFEEKVPVVTESHLHAGSDYPQRGVIACTVEGRRAGPEGLPIVEVDTGAPWGIASTAGRCRFLVGAHQLVDL